MERFLSQGDIWAFYLWLLVISLYFYLLPTLVAHIRHKRNLGGIAVLNVLTGWTAVGWIIALVWAFMVEPERGGDRS